MIHADMHHDNVMVDGNHLAVIDFDVLVNALFEGYRRERLISTQDIDMLPTFLLVRSLAIFGLG